MAIKVQGTTVIDDSRDISNVGVATVGILSVGSYIYDSNGVFGSTNQVLTSVPGIGVSWANQSGSGGASEYYTANAQYTISGGGTVTFDGSNIKWSHRVILIPVEKTEFSSNGYIDINCPTSGTIPHYKSDNTLGTATCTSNGIPIAQWEGLWYRVTPGQSNVSVASKFALVHYINSNWSPDEGWVLIATRNGDGLNGGHLKWLPGQINFPNDGGVYDSRYATSNWQDNITEGNTSAEVVDTGSDGHFKVTTEGTERLRVTSDGSVGIGTTNPSTKLHVQFTGDNGIRVKSEDNHSSVIIDSGSGSGSYLRFKDGGSDAYWIHENSSHLDFRPSAGTAKARFSSDGKFVVGSTAAVARFTVDDSTGDAPCVLLTDVTNSRYAVGFGNQHVTGVGQRLDFYAGDSGSNGTNLTSTHRRMSLTADGKLGIGTDNPTEKLDVWGSIRASQGSQQYIKLYPVGGAGYYDVSNTTSYPSIVFRQIGSGGTQERMRISSGGNVGIGTDNPGTKLDVHGLTTIENASSQLLLHQASNSPTVIHRNDGSDYYILLSNAGLAPSNTWNSLRPFAISMTNGQFRSTNGQYFDGVTSIGSNTTTGTGNQDLQVFTGAYVSGNLGIGITNPGPRLHVYSGAANYVAKFESADADAVLLLSDNTTSGDGILVKRSGSELIYYGGTANTEVFRIDDNQNIGIGSTQPTAKLDVNGDVAIASTVSIGTTIDIVPYNDLGMLSFEASQGQLFAITNNLSSGSIFSVNPISGIPIIDVHADRTIQLNPYGGNTGIGTTNPTAKLDVRGTLNVTGVSTFGGNVYLGDNDSLSLGDSSDLVLFHNGSHSFVDDNGVGSLYLRSGVGGVFITKTTGDVMGGFNPGGSVELYHNAVKKFETTSSGVTVTGTVTADGLSLGDNEYAYFGDSNDLQIFHESSSGDSVIKENGGGNLRLGGANVEITSPAGSETYASFNVNGSVELYYDGSKKFETTGIGVSIVGTGNTATITGPSNLVLDPAAVGDNTGTVTILGNLQVDGTQTVINSTVMTVDDLNITLASGAANASAANGAGITVDGASATLTYSSTGDTWVFNKAPYYNTDRLLTTADEGSGNGIDADTVDGIDSAAIVYGLAGAGVSALNTTQNVYELGQYKAGFWDVNGASWTPNTGWWWGATFAHRSNGPSYNYSGQLAFQNGNGGNGIYARTINNGTATSWSKLWSDGNDGTGSGLDADTVDGLEATSFIRSDADDTTTGQIQLTKANSATTGGGQIYLNGANGNRIDFVGSSVGVAAPAFTTRSVGTKIVLYPQVGASSVDYALGIENGTLWRSIPDTSSSKQHRWYGGTTQLADLKGSGELVIGSTSLTGTASQKLQVTGGAYVSGNLGVGATLPPHRLTVDGSGTANTGTTIARFRNISSSNRIDIIDETTTGNRPPGILSPSASYGLGLYAAGGPIRFYPASTSTEKIRIDNSGNLLINTTSATGTSSQPLQVSGGAYVSGDVGIGLTAPTAKLEIPFNGTAAGQTLRLGGTDNLNGDYIYAIGFGNPNNTQMGIGPHGTNRSIWNREGITHHIHSGDEWTIKSSSWTNLFGVQGGTGNVYMRGSVGINTTAPGSTLAVGGTITELYNGSYWNVVTQADVGYGASQVPLNQYLGQLAFLDDHHPNGLRRDGGGSDDVVVSAGGTVGIGTDTIGVSGYALEVRGKVYFSNGGAGQDGLDMHNCGITAVNRLTFNDPGPGEGIVWENGSGWSIYESPNDLTTNSAGNLQFVDSGSRILTLDTSGNAEFTGDVTVDQLITNNNGNSQNVRIGDDVWLGDMNLANTLRIRGNQDQTQGYIVFGTSNATKLGRSGTGPLNYGGDFTVDGNLGIGSTQPAAKLDVTGDTNVTGYQYRGDSVKTASLFVRGTGLNHNSNRHVYLNGTRIVNTNSRGLTLTVIGAGLTHVSSTNYDTFGNGTNSTNLATAIGNIDVGEIGVLSSYDAWELYVNDDLRTAALKVGLTKLGTYSGGGSRRPYAAVFYGTSDDIDARPRDVIERMESSDADAPEASIFCNLATESFAGSMSIPGAVSVNALYSSQSTTQGPVVVVDSANNVGVGTLAPAYKLHVNGSFAATTKSFVIDHPTKDGMKLRYGSLEGPENGVYVRGRLKGNNTIELPDHWTGLVDEETITVNLTPIGRKAPLHSVVDIADNTVVVESANDVVDCFYTVFGERKDVEKLEVEF